MESEVQATNTKITEQSILNCLYFGDDYSFFAKLEQDIKSNIKYTSFQKVDDLADYVSNNQDKNLVILAEYTTEKGISGLMLHKLLLERTTTTPTFLLLSDPTLKQEQILLAKDQGIKDVLLKNADITGVVARIEYHDLAKEEKTIKKRPKIKSKMSILKRIFDITSASIALILLSPFLLLVVLLIKIDSPGPIFYISKRVGTDAKVFNFYKFRSMKKDAGKMIGQMAELNQYASNTKEEEETDLSSCEKCLANGGSPCSPMLIVDGQEICETLHLKRKAMTKSSFLKFKMTQE